MDKIILKQYVAKWKKAVGFLESQVSDMSREETAAFFALKDFWKSQYSGTMASAYKASINTLKQSHKYHINNKPLIESSKDLCLIASAALKDKDSFYEFQDALSGGASFRPVEPPHASTNSSSQRRSAPSSGSRQFGGATPSDVVVHEVRFRCTDSYGSNLSNFDTYLERRATTLYPTIKYSLNNQATGPYEITYKIYDSDGRLIQVNSMVGTTLYSTDPNAGWKECSGVTMNPGIYALGNQIRIDFYYGGNVIYSANVPVIAQSQPQQPQWQQPQPPRQQPQQSSNSDSDGCLSNIFTIIFWVAVFNILFQMCN